MDKVKTIVRIGGKEYTISGTTSEEYMHRVAIYVDKKYNEIAKAHSNLSTSMIAVLAALNIADELLRERNEVQPRVSLQAAPSTEARLDNISTLPERKR